MEEKSENPAWEFIDWLTTGQIVKLIIDENPQTIAVVVARLGKGDPRKAAEILSGLDLNLQADVMKRMGQLEDLSEWIETSIFEGLRKKYVGD
jgi:flagellar motor switch protein FliG